MQTKKGQVLLTILFIVSACTVMFSGMGVMVIMNTRGEMIKINLTERLLGDSFTLTRVVHAEEIAAIAGPEDVNTELYAELKERLARYAGSNNLSRAYFARKTEDGRLQYIVDSSFGDKSEGVNTPPRKFLSSKAVLDQAFGGKTAVQDITVYVEGAEGIMSSFSPVFDKAGNVIAVAGVDLPDLQVVRLEWLSTLAGIMVVLAAIFSTVSGAMSLVSYHRAAVRAAALNVSKNLFLANMSHEMRTPLNAIIGFSDLLLAESGLDEVMERTVRKIYTAGGTLLSIINDLLDLSKIEAGKFELNPVEYDLPSMVNDVVSFNLIRIGEKPIQFVLELPEDMPSRLFGDDLRVRQICSNLLSNAFKYTMRGTVTLRLSTLPDGLEYVWLRIQVEDTGIGIRQESLNKLFADYVQLDTGSSRKIEGTGLGLSLSKYLVEMMGGTITVESEFGKGSVFTARIRQRFVTNMPIGAEVVRNLKNHQFFDKRLTGVQLSRIPMPYAAVLVVDDNENNLDIAKGILKAYRMRVDCVKSGAEAIDLIRQGKPRYSAIFMDHMMPIMDGIEAVRIIREEIGSEYAQTIPIIALTANAIIGNEEMFLKKGFQAFLSKPMDVIRLDAVLRQWVRNKMLENTQVTEAPAPAASLPDTGGDPAESGSFEGWKVEGLDTRKGLERFGGDADIYANVLSSYARTTRPLIEKLRAVTAEEIGEYAITVHGIKSSSQGIGADTAGEAAATLEAAAKNGDWAFVNEHNGPFLRSIEELIGGIERKFLAPRSGNAKPRKPEPEPSCLAALAAACARFDIDGADAAMKALGDFDYDQGTDLVEWLRKQMGVSGYRQIAERLKSEGF